MYIYIDRGRERERERDTHIYIYTYDMCIYICAYIYMCMYGQRESFYTWHRIGLMRAICPVVLAHSQSMASLRGNSGGCWFGDIGQTGHHQLMAVEGRPIVHRRRKRNLIRRNCRNCFRMLHNIPALSGLTVT